MSVISPVVIGFGVRLERAILLDVVCNECCILELSGLPLSIVRRKSASVFLSVIPVGKRTFRSVIVRFLFLFLASVVIKGEFCC